MTSPRISINTSDDFDPSERLRNALESVARAAEAQAADGPSEVEGFGNVLQIGSLGVRGSVQGWNDGCWGFKRGPGGHCNWFQDSDDVPPSSCVGYSF